MEFRFLDTKIRFKKSDEKKRGICEMFSPARLALFISTTSKVCENLVNTLLQRKLNIPRIRLDTEDARERVANKITTVPCLMVVDREGQIHLIDDANNIIAYFNKLTSPKAPPPHSEDDYDEPPPRRKKLPPEDFEEEEEERTPKKKPNNRLTSSKSKRELSNKTPIKNKSFNGRNKEDGRYKRIDEVETVRSKSKKSSIRTSEAAKKTSKKKDYDYSSSEEEESPKRGRRRTRSPEYRSVSQSPEEGSEEFSEEGGDQEVEDEIRNDNPPPNPKPIDPRELAKQKLGGLVIQPGLANKSPGGKSAAEIAKEMQQASGLQFS